MGKQQKLKIERRQEREKYSEIQRRLLPYRIGIVLFIMLGIGGGVYLGFFQQKNASENVSGDVSEKVENQGPQQENNPSSEGDTPADQQSQDQEELQKPLEGAMKTSKGTIEFQLYRQAAPKTVDNFVKLINDGFYEQTTFHRVVENFIIQGGDPNSKDDDPSNDGQGGPGYTFEDEINPQSLGMSDEQITALEQQGYVYRDDIQSIPVEKGVIAMANSGPNTNGSQFFIVTTKAQPHLYGKHTVFGYVTSGMDVVTQIKQGDKIEAIFVNSGDQGSTE